MRELKERESETEGRREEKRKKGIVVIPKFASGRGSRLPKCFTSQKIDITRKYRYLLSFTASYTAS